MLYLFLTPIFTSCSIVSHNLLCRGKPLRFIPATKQKVSSQDELVARARSRHVAKGEATNGAPHSPGESLFFFFFFSVLRLFKKVSLYRVLHTVYYYLALSKINECFFRLQEFNPWFQSHHSLLEPQAELNPSLLRLNESKMIGIRAMSAKVMFRVPGSKCRRLLILFTSLT